MARLLFAFELGGGLGHLHSWAAVIRMLAGRGHEVSVAVRELAGAEALFADTPVRLLQAPVWFRPPPRGSVAASHAELLAHHGFNDVARLRGLVQGWQSLLQLTGADLLLLNHSPTAGLAAHGLGRACVTIGTGFECPPALAPLPALPAAARVASARLTQAEREVLAGVNLLVAESGAAPLGDLGSLWPARRTLLCTLPELDPYARWRPDAEYLGPRLMLEPGDPPLWPGGDGPRVLAYLKTAHGNLDGILGALAASGARVLAHVSGLTADMTRRHHSPRLELRKRALRMGDALAECDLVVCHGGHGMIAGALLAGRPSLVLPINLEQWLNGRAAVALGAALCPPPERGLPDLRRLLGRLLQETGFTASARTLAAQHAAGVASDAQVAERIEGLLCE